MIKQGRKLFPLAPFFLEVLKSCQLQTVKILSQYLNARFRYRNILPLRNLDISMPHFITKQVCMRIHFRH